MSVAIMAHSRMPAALARHASQKIIASAPTGKWTVAGVTLKKFHTVLHKTVLLKELLVHGIEVQGVQDYILEAFNHTCTSYNTENPIHLLAIIASIACIGLLPAIFVHDADLKDNVPSNRVALHSVSATVGLGDKAKQEWGERGDRQGVVHPSTDVVHPLPLR